MDRRNGNHEQSFTIAWSAIFKVLAACLLAATVVRLSRFLELVGLAILISIAFRPIFHWVLRHKWPKWAGICLCAFILFGATALVLGIIVPPVVAEGGQFVKQLPEFKTNLLQHLPQSGPVRNVADEMLASSSFSNPEPLLKKIITWSGSGLEIIAGFFAVLVMAVYFVADGKRVYDWLSAFLPRNKRLELNSSIDEITAIVSRYVAGNALTSLMCAAYAFTVLSILGVPNAVLLAALAGIFDLLPVIGFFIFATPAALVALTVSPKIALAVFLLFGAYHLCEAYFIIPKIYGNQLKLSGLTVLLCCLATGIVAGVIGILLILPLVACYPIVERIWLKNYMEPETISRHHAIETRANAKSN